MAVTKSGFTVVLLFDDPLGSAKKIVPILASVRRVPALDVNREVRSCWGLIGENRPEEEAAATVAALNGAGLASALVPTASLAALAAIQASKKIEVEDGGFRCQMARGATPLIPWSAPSFLAAALIKTSSFKNVTKREGPSQSEKAVRMGITLITGIPIPGGRSREVTKRQETTSLMAVLDIGFEKPAGRIRLEGDRTDLSYLGARRTYDSLGNFRLMVADAASRMAVENVNRGAQLMMAKGNLTDMGYDSLAEFEREERWMMARRALRGAGH